MRIIVLTFLFTVNAHAGTVLDDILNLASLGEYHRQYDLARTQVDQDIARANRQHQESLKGVERDKALSLLGLYEGQYRKALLTYRDIEKVVNIHQGIFW